MQIFWNLVNRISIQHRNHCPLFDVGEERDLFAGAVVDIDRASAQQYICLKTYGAQFLDRVLSWLSFNFTRGRNVGHQGEVHEQCTRCTRLKLQLPQRFQERLTLDITDGTSHLNDRHIGSLSTRNHTSFDLICDVRNDLNSST